MVQHEEWVRQRILNTLEGKTTSRLHTKMPYEYYEQSFMWDVWGHLLVSETIGETPPLVLLYSQTSKGEGLDHGFSQVLKIQVLDL
jgi:hypothetical protein